MADKITVRRYPVASWMAADYQWFVGCAVCDKTWPWYGWRFAIADANDHAAFHAEQAAAVDCD